MHNLVTSYDFQLEQNYWTWIWIYSLHTAEERLISTQSVVLGFYREFIRGHMAEFIRGTDTGMSGTCVHR